MLKKLMAVLMVAVMVFATSVSAFAYNGDPTVTNYGYGYNNYGYSYNYYNCTGIRTTYSDEEYQPSSWFDTYAEQYGVVFHLYPTMPISRSDVFAPVGKAMDNAYNNAGRNFSTAYGVNFVDFTWDSSLYPIAGGLYQRGIMIGYPEDNTVRFPQNITRAEFAKVLVLTAKQNGVYSSYNTMNSQFTDIAGHWAEQYINECNAMGLMVGKSVYNFAPEHTVTYEEYVTVMLRMAERASNSSYAMNVDDIAYGISSTMDIDFEGYGYAEIDDIEVYGSKTVYAEVGETIELKVKATPSDVELKNNDVEWTSGKSSYLRFVDNDVDGRYATAEFKALKEGKVTVTAELASDDDITATFTVVISDEEDYEDVNVTSIKVSPSELELTIGESKAITATVYPTTATNKGIVWESHNENVAIVNQNGKITAVGVGSTTVTATSEDDSNIIATIDVTVTAEVITPDDTTAPLVEVTGADNVTVGGKVKFTVRAYDENLKDFLITEADILNLAGALSISKIEKTSDDTYVIEFMGVEVCAVEPCIRAGVAVDASGNKSAESNGVVVLINSGEVIE